MDSERIELLYRILIETDSLFFTKEVLLSYGFTYEEIEFLVVKKILKSNSEGNYELVTIEKFRRYGVKLLLNRQMLGATTCFRKCYELAPNGRDICLQYMLMQLKRKYPNYKEIFETYDNLEKIHSDKNINNNNVILYLLGILTECPERYIERLSSLSYDDLMLPSVKCNKDENEIIMAILNSKFTFAYSKINDLIAKCNGYSVRFELMKVLLLKVIECERHFKKDLLYFAKTEQYARIVSSLKKRQKQKYLGSLEMYILIISEALVEILQTNTIPSVSINYTSDMYEALRGNNFSLALDINDEFLSYTGGNKEEDIVNILLVNLNKIILRLKESFETTDIGFEDKRDTLENVGVQQNINLIFEQSEFLGDILEAEYWLDYIINENMSFDDAKKQLGLSIELILMIKLVYVINCYGYRFNGNKCYVATEDSISVADSMLKEVELFENKSKKVLELLRLACEYRKILSTSVNSYKRILEEKE